MKWEQIIIAVWFIFSVLSAYRDDGKERTYKVSFLATLILLCLVSWVLFKGGFWS